MEINETVACAVQNSTLIVVVLAEQLRDSLTVQKLRSGILHEIEQSKVKNVVIDLSQVKQIGSIAFLAFLAIRRHSGIDRILLCNLSQMVQELFGMCKLIATGNGKAAPFEQASSVEEALVICGET